MRAHPLGHTEHTVVKTRVVSVVFRLILAALGLYLAWLLVSEGGDAGDVLQATVYAALGLFLLTVRVRERAVLDDHGITLTYAPFGIGPFPLDRRETFVPWERVLRVRESKRGGFPMYYVRLQTGTGWRLTWTVGIHTTHYREALDALVRKTAAGVVDAEVSRRVERWQREGLVGAGHPGAPHPQA